MKTALVIGGGATDPRFLARIRAPDNLVLCADSGAEYAREAGIVPDLLVGDLDSISPETLDFFQELGVEIHRDGSGDLLDMEIAVEAAGELGAERVVILGGWGDRIDQSLAVLGLLHPGNIPVSVAGKHPVSFTGEVVVVTERCLITPTVPGVSVRTMQGDRMAIIPLPRAREVTTSGLEYGLAGANLSFPSVMSVSNVATGDHIEVDHASGDLAVIRWFDDPAVLEARVRELTGRAGLPADESGSPQDENGYLRTVRAIFDHGGTVPRDPAGKEHRLGITGRLLDALVPGHRELGIVHVAGTCGKGSTCLYLHHILSQRYRSGLLISPHLYDPCERIQVNGTPISHRDLVRIWHDLLPRIRAFETEHGVLVLYQEIFLLMALTHFLEQGVEWAVIETGLGGRYDQTRMVNARVTAITRIDLDHTHILGTTIPEIAREKAGIIRPGIPLYTAETADEVLDIFASVCRELGSSMIRCAPDGSDPGGDRNHEHREQGCRDHGSGTSSLGEGGTEPGTGAGTGHGTGAETGHGTGAETGNGIGAETGNVPEAGSGYVPEAGTGHGHSAAPPATGSVFRLAGVEYRIRQPGSHQVANAALAVAIARDELGLKPAMIREGLLGTILPARIEVRGRLIIDSGHNPRETRALAETVRGLVPISAPIIVVCGIAKDKDHRAMLAPLVGLADVIILTRAGYRGEEPVVLRERIREMDDPGMDTGTGTGRRAGGILMEPRPEAAYRLARAIRDAWDRDAWIMVTGSTFLVDEIFNPDPDLLTINAGEGGAGQ